MNLQPDTCHPALINQKEDVVRLLESHNKIVLSVTNPIQVSEKEIVFSLVSFRVYTCFQHAPYTGRPYLYTWRVAVDETDILWVAGSVNIEYIPYNIDHDDYGCQI